MSTKINARIDYEPARICHIAVQCPDCKNWFNANDISNVHFSDDSDLEAANYLCPVCKLRFTGEMGYAITETFGRDTYAGCLEPNTTWE